MKGQTKKQKPKANSSFDDHAPDAVLELKTEYCTIPMTRERPKLAKGRRKTKSLSNQRNRN